MDSPDSIRSIPRLVEMKKILLLIANMEVGGAQRATASLATALAKHHYQLYIGVFDTSGGIQFPCPGKILDIETPGSSSFVKKIINIILRIYRVWKIKKKYKIDYAIAFADGPNIVNILSYYPVTRTILTVHTFVSRNSINAGFYGKIFNILMRKFYNFSNHIVTVSNEIKSDLIEQFNCKENKISVIYNAIDCDSIMRHSFQKLSKNSESIFNSPVLITVGRLTEAKGYHYLLKIYKAIQKEIQTLKLVVIGDGELRESLISYATELSLPVYSVWDDSHEIADQQVYFLGSQSNPFQYMHAASVFAFTSIWEGFGLALVEAMACGIPVVSTNCKAGPKEILKDGDSEFGILIPHFTETYPENTTELSDSEKQFSNAVIQLLKDPKISHYYAKAGQKRATAFDQKEIVSQWINLLEQLK